MNRSTSVLSATLIYNNISLTFEKTWLKLNTREYKISKKFIRKCKTWNVYHYKIYSRIYYDKKFFLLALKGTLMQI